MWTARVGPWLLLLGALCSGKMFARNSETPAVSVKMTQFMRSLTHAFIEQSNVPLKRDDLRNLDSLCALTAAQGMHK